MPKRNIEKELRIVDLYLAGKTHNEIMRTIGLSIKTDGWIEIVLRRHNIPLRGNVNTGNSRTIFWDFDFFSRNTPTIAYWAGFIMADGNIRKTGGTWRMSIKLNIVDLHHLQTFCDDIGLDRDVIKVGEKESGYGISSYCEVDVTSKTLGETLLRWGIVPRKTYEWAEPTVPRHLLPHFLRGWLDGDGSINKNYQALYVCGHMNAMLWYRDAVNSIGYSKTSRVSDAKNNTHRFCIGGRLHILEFYNVLCGMEYPRLDRKWCKVEDIINKQFSYPCP